MTILITEGRRAPTFDGGRGLFEEAQARSPSDKARARSRADRSSATTPDPAPRRGGPRDAYHDA